MGRPQLTTEAVDEMRQHLVASALDLYLHQGLDALTFRALADAVGVSHTLAYRYFDDKEALLAAMRVECTQRFERFVREHEDVQAPLLMRVRSVAMAYVEYVRRHPGEYLLIFSTNQPSPSQNTALLEARRSLFEHAVDVVQACVDRGELHGDARGIAHAFWVTLHGLMTLHVADQLVHGRTLDELVEPVVERLLEHAVPRTSHPATPALKRSRTRSLPPPRARTRR